MLHNRLLQDKEMTVKHDCDKSSCRTFLSHRVFIIIYIFKSNVWRLYDIQVRREKALGDAVLWWHTPIGLAALL